jgi:hypothetical protein
MSGDMSSILYLVDQFPSAAVRLKDVWHHFISRVFEPISCTTGVFTPSIFGRRLAFPSVGGRTLGPGGERCQVGRNIVYSFLEFVDLFFCAFVVVP